MKKLPSIVSLRPALLPSLAVFSLVMLRSWLTGRLGYSFISMNLMLAWIPVGLSYLIIRNIQLKHSLSHSILLGLLALLWLVFFPNASYVITDSAWITWYGLPSEGSIFWFDLLLLFLNSFTGCMLAYLSLRQLHNLVVVWKNTVWGWSFVTAATILSSTGIYIGRFLRWNSWDIITQPLAFIQNVIQAFTSSALLNITWFIALYTVIQLVIYLSLVLLTDTAAVK